MLPSFAPCSLSVPFFFQRPFFSFPLVLNASPLPILADFCCRPLLDAAARSPPLRHSSPFSPVTDCFSKHLLFSPDTPSGARCSPVFPRPCSIPQFCPQSGGYSPPPLPFFQSSANSQPWTLHFFLFPFLPKNQGVAREAPLF